MINCLRIEQKDRPRFSADILVMCLGNPLRGDDIFGLLVFRLLRKLRVPALYAGATPENVVQLLRKVRPKLIIVVDALLGVDEGLFIVRLSDEQSLLPSSHSLPLKLLIQSSELDPERIIVIGAGAKEISIGSRPNEKIWDLAIEAASIIVRLLERRSLP
ncbi:MAG: hydrogenase maturation protease [Desulfurococcaceae archaeon]